MTAFAAHAGKRITWGPSGHESFQEAGDARPSRLMHDN